MPSVTIEVPDFEYSGFYYPEILEDLILYNRTALPDLDDEDPAEPYIQILRSVALAAHLNNVLLDAVARERFITTARLRTSVAAHLALIGVTLDQPNPAVADLLFELSREFTAQTTVIPANSAFATEATAETEGIQFEVLTDVATARTDELTDIFSYDESTSTWTTHTIGAAVTPGWAGAPEAGDLLYFGHTDMLWSTLAMYVSTAASGLTQGVWEYYDGDLEDTTPDSVTDQTTYITLELNDWLGTSDRTGTLVRVKCNLTGAYEDDLAVYYSGGVNKVDTAGKLGQATISTDTEDYSVGSLWQEFPDVVDETGMLKITGTKSLSFTLPQTTTLDWKKLLLGPTGAQVEAYWIRFRVISASGGSIPSLAAYDPSTGDRYLLSSATQGQAYSEDPLGSSDGMANQEFTFANYPVIDDVTLIVYVDEGSGDEAWTRVDNFINSTYQSKHFRVIFDNDGRATIQFGDGTNGKTPDAGTDNISAAYRVLEEQNGNVGAGTITVNRAGNAYLGAITNPRAASGYAVAEGSTEAGLELAKITGPAELRVQGRGVTPQDIELLTKDFEAADSTKPFGRALAIEESFGDKTVEVVVVGAGGSTVPTDYLTELEEYFNGTADRTTRGVLLLNTEATASNYTPHAIDVTATVYGGEQEAIESALATFLSAGALRSDGVTYEWDFGEDIPRSRIIAAIMGTAPYPRNVVLTAPASDVVMAARELPTIGTITLTMVA